MQLPEKLKIFVLTPDEGPSLETSKFPLYFSGSCIPTGQRKLTCSYYWHWHVQAVQVSKLHELSILCVEILGVCLCVCVCEIFNNNMYTY
jgi:hypothetical protein